MDKFENAVDHIHKLAGDYKCWDNQLTEKEAVELSNILSKRKNKVKMRPTGHWIQEKSYLGENPGSYQCSVCGRSIHLDTKVEDLSDYPYCHCGAKMYNEQDPKRVSGPLFISYVQTFSWADESVEIAAKCPVCRHFFERGLSDWKSEKCPDCGQELNWDFA